ncbi:MAG: 3-phosphoshikimate 1-carboxyvinyltransferase [Clostridia bacterium]|nr:3-phosphoshikimate 1-carboxyvinyltransferase [Clostridia bacterium]
MIAKISPSKISGCVKAPPSKSMAHRYIICASLAEGKSRIDNIAYSEDIKATLDCMEALGAKIHRGEGYVEIDGTDTLKATPKTILGVRESGSTLRFMIPIALLSGNKTEFCGSTRLFERPLGVYEAIAKENGFEFEKCENGLSVCGRLNGGKYYINDNKSSQFITGLLLALPLLDDDSEIILESFPESKPYIDMTMEAMRDFGVRAEFDGERVFRIFGNQKYTARNITVEGDCSNAAFFEALNIVGGEASVSGIRKDTLQGDAIYLDYFKKIKEGNPVLDISDCPDLAPILLALLAECGGGRLVGTRRLRFKESDRGEVMKKELSKFGAKIICLENQITVENTKLHTPTERISSNSDHRVVMACAVLMTKYGGEIDGCEDCAKSMPEFFERMAEVGMDVRMHNA